MIRSEKADVGRPLRLRRPCSHCSYQEEVSRISAVQRSFCLLNPLALPLQKKADAALANVVALAVISGSDEDSEAKAKAAGFQGILMQPLRQATVGATIMTTLGVKPERSRSDAERLKVQETTFVLLRRPY
jgi:PleD family two-component response regulator